MLPFMKSLGTREYMGTVWKRSLPCDGRIQIKHPAPPRFVAATLGEFRVSLSNLSAEGRVAAVAAALHVSEQVENFFLCQNTGETLGHGRQL